MLSRSSGRRVIVLRTRHDLASLVSSVSFVTATGNLDRVVTPLAVFRATPAGLRLEAVQPGAALEEVTCRTGFAVEPLGEIGLLASSTAAELAPLEALDPDRLRDLDFR